MVGKPIRSGLSALHPLLFSRDEAIGCAMVERTIAHYLDLKPIPGQALKEAMTA